MRALAAAVVLLASPAAGEPLPPPKPEVVAQPKQVVVPAVPSFALPGAEPGFVSVGALHAGLGPAHGTEVRVKGYVTWIYDCVTDVRQRGETRAQAQRRIDDDPTLCERHKFYIADTRTTPRDRSLWVVDVPRPPNKLERERLPKDELAAWPAVPKLRVGQYVELTGIFALHSPHREHNSDGLVIFKAVKPAKPGKPLPAIELPATPPAIAPLQIARVTPKSVARSARNESIKHANQGSRALGQKQLDEAIEHYEKALAAWDGNHNAAYGLGGARLHKRDYAAASRSFLRAVALEPEVAMYQMFAGIALYEDKQHDRALQHLTRALELNDQLWRAHYYIGRIYRERQRARWAAQAFTAAIAHGPRDDEPYIALADMYLRYAYYDEALAVSDAGVLNSPETTELLFVAGRAYEGKRDVARAIRAYDDALLTNPQHPRSLFQRGVLHHGRRAYAKARADLEAFLASPSQDSFARVQARQLLESMPAGRGR